MTPTDSSATRCAFGASISRLVVTVTLSSAQVTLHSTAPAVATPRRSGRMTSRAWSRSAFTSPPYSSTSSSMVDSMPARGTRSSVNSLTCPLIPHRDVVFLNLRLERIPRQAEAARGLADPASGRLQRALDELAVDRGDHVVVDVAGDVQLGD